MKNHANLFDRVLSWVLALALVFSLAFPYGGIQIHASAAEPDNSSGQGSDPGKTKATVTLNLTNCTLTEEDGETKIEAPLTVEVGSNLKFKVVPATGCEGGTVTIDGTPATLDPQQIYQLTVTQNSVITAVSNDVTDPTMDTPARTESGWVQSATYTFTAQDNIAVAKAVLLNEEAEETILSKNEDGKYVAEITKNGTYTIMVYDADKNSDSEQITETQVDPDAPSIDSLERNTTGVAESASYTMTASDSLSGIAKVTLQVGEDGEEQEVQPNENGFYTLVVSNQKTHTVRVYDNAGGVTTKPITDPQIDLEGPEIQNLSRNQEGWQKDSVTYTFQVSDALSEVASVKFDATEETAQEVTANEDGSYTVTIPENGTYVILAEDSLGHTSRETITEEQIDKSAPVLTSASRNEEGWQAKAVYTIIAADEQSGISSVTATDAEGNAIAGAKQEDGSYTLTITANGSYTVTVTNGAGGTETTSITEEYVDDICPTILDLKRTSDAWEKEATYTFRAEDAQSCIEDVTVTIGKGEPVTLTAENGLYSFSMKTNETYLVVVTDKVGNKADSNGTETQVDTTAPEISDITRQQSGWAKEATYQFTVTDSQSGVKEVTVTVGNQQPKVLTAEDGKYSFTVPANDSFVVTATDNLGNSDTKNGTESQIDTTAPVISTPARMNEDWAKEARYSFTVLEEQSGIASVTVKIGDGEPATLTAEDGIYSFTIVENQTFTITATDNLGHSDTANGTETKVDTTNPEIGAVTRTEKGWSPTATYTFTASDSQSGVKSVSVQIGLDEPKTITPENGIYSFTMTANTTYQIVVVDHAGNQNSTDGTESKVDADDPVISELSRSVSGWATSAAYSFTTAEPLSGIKSVTYRIGNEAEIVLEPGEDGSYTFPVGQNGTYTVTVTDNAGNIGRNSVTESLIDTTKPEILDLSRTETGWAKTASYSFSARDTQSGISSVTVQIGEGEHTALTAKDGIYSFVLSENVSFCVTVTDLVGNQQTKSLQENRVDDTAPEISTVLRNGTDWQTEASYAFTVADSQSGVGSVTVTIGNAAPVTLTTTNGTYSFTVKENTSYTITATDNVGNQNTTSGTESKVDTTAPTISAVQRQQTGWATSATYVFTVQDSQCGVNQVTVKLGDGEPTVLTEKDGQYSFTVTANTKFTVTATDKLGNSDSVNGEEIYVDTTDPVISNLTRMHNDWAKTAQYTFQVEDSQSGVMQVMVTIGGKTTKLNPEDGVYSFTMTANEGFVITASDALGHVTTLPGTESKIDVTAPSIGTVKRTESGWATSATYTFTAEDTQSGIASCTVTFGEGQPQALQQKNGVYSFTMTENTTYTILVTDNLGNSNSASGTETLVDTTKPVVSQPIRSHESWQTGTSYTFTASDSQSGVASVTVRLGNGTPKALTPEENGSYVFAVSANGTYTVVVTDNVGNSETKTVVESYIDTTAPAIRDVTRQESGWATSATYTFWVEETQSGVKEVTVTVGNQQAKVLTAVNGKYSFTLGANDSFTIRAVDLVGNDSTKDGTESQVDTTGPQIESPVRLASSWVYSATYQIRITDPQSGIASVTVTPSNGTPATLTADKNGVYTYIAEKNTTYTITAIDKVGNPSTQTFTEEKVDYTAPTIANVKRDPNDWSKSSVYTFTVTDLQSGVKNVRVVMGDQAILLTSKGDGSYSFTSVANGTYTITATDVVGNEQKITVGETLIDQKAPVIHSVEPQNTWHPTENTVKFHITDESLLDRVLVKDSQGTNIPVKDNGNGIFSIVVTSNGDYRVTAIDRAGNETSQSFTVWHIDTEQPTTPELASTSNGKWVNRDVTVTATATDSQSGVVAYWYSTEGSTFDAKTWKQMTFSSGDGSLLLTEDQDIDYYVVAQDEVGRISETSKIHISIDKKAPAVLSAAYVTGENSGFRRIVNGSYLYNDVVTFQANAKDEASGIIRYEYRIAQVDGSAGDWISLDANEDGFTRTISNLSDSINEVWFRVYDVAGNCSREFTVAANGSPVRFVLETTPDSDSKRSPAPEVEMTVSANTYQQEWTAEDVTITVSGSSAISGIEYYEYSVDHADPAIQDVSWTKVPVKEGKAQITVSADTNATYSFRAVTYAGNPSQTVSRIVRVQKTAPNARVITSETATGTNGWYTKYPSYTVNAVEQNPYFAPVHYLLTYTYQGTTEPEYKFDEKNAPAISKDGIWDVTVISVDAAGNRATVPASTAHFEVDTKVPNFLTVTKDGTDILSISGNGVSNWDQINSLDVTQQTNFAIFHNSPVTIRATADGGDSGMAGIYYQIVAEAEDYSQSGSWTALSEDGLQLNPNSKCRLYFKAVDVAGNCTYFSGRSIVMDDTAPQVITLAPDTSNRSDRGFYPGDVTVNFQVKDPATGKDGALAGLSSVSYRVLRDGWESQSGQLYPGNSQVTTNADGLIDTCSGSFVINAQRSNSNHIVVELTVVDAAGNVQKSYIQEGEIKVDVDMPTMTGSYDSNAINAVFGTDSIFTGNRTLTVVATERNLDNERSYVQVTDTDTGRTYTAQWQSEGSQHTVVIPLTEDGHYKVTARVTDTAGNTTTNLQFAEGTVAATAFVIDNTAPVIDVTYDNNNVKASSYFDAPRTMTVWVTERNFNPANINVLVQFTSEAGVVSALPLSQWSHDGNAHYATVTCSESGKYAVTVNGSDAVNNNATKVNFSGAALYTFIVDTHIDSPEISGVKEGSAYSGEVKPAITAVDTNLEDVTIQILRTRRNEIRKDVTEELLGKDLEWTEITGGKEITLDVFAKEAELDGIYTIIATSTDKAGNTASREVTFSVNRFGSVYVYDDYLVEIIGGTMQKLNQDLIVTEYNASGVVAGSARVYITVDGMPISDPIFEIVPSKVGEDDTGESGWYEYQYVISKENFTQDGQYTVVISTKDEAGNLPENTSEDMAIRFAIDTTAPELSSVSGMEKRINKADSLNVTITASDNVLLDYIIVTVDGEEVQRWEQIDSFQFEGTFSISEGLDRQVQILVVDKAGNTLDTASEDFAPGYAFCDSITVSSNALLRFYANKPLFWGSICGVVAVAGTTTWLLLKKKKPSKDTPSAEQDTGK